MRAFIWKLVASNAMIMGAWAQPADMPKNSPKNACVKDNAFYLKIGSGASVANRAGVFATPSVWVPAVEGYNAGLGTVPILLGGLGFDSPFVSTDLTASYRPNFSYKKFQTAVDPSLGTRTRRFNLDVSSMMLSVYFNGRGFRSLNWETGCGGSVYPIIGGGIGSSQMRIFNFRSTGLPPVAGGSYPAFTSENQYTISYRFTYQVMAGLEYRYRNWCALSVGYRWFDVSRFRGPRYIRDLTGNSQAIPANGPWKIKYSANEAFVEFKVFL